MKFIYPSSCKINLTLRIYSHRSDGYHDIYSVFWRFSSPESLTITSFMGNNVRDVIKVSGTDIKGTNIVDSMANFLRSKGMAIPPFEVKIDKKIPPGTGVGGGSGNAAAFFRWSRDIYGSGIEIEDLVSIGADVPFMASSCSMAAVEGVGGDLEPLTPLDGYSCILVIPTWRSQTGLAYNALDRMYEVKGWSMDRDSAKEEAMSIVRSLRCGKKTGLLPNDFIKPLLGMHPDYNKIFSIFEKYDLNAWGLSGSGSSSFALFPSGELLPSGFMNELSSLKCIEKILFLE